MQLNNIDVRVLIKGRPIKEYLHQGDIFVEGREGSDFEIQVSNNNYFDCEAILSVDGLSIIDGKAAGAESAGYFVPRNQTVVIPGWMVNPDAVAKFVFSGKGNSYAKGVTGSSDNSGIIGAMVFAEGRNRARPVSPSRQRNPLPRPAPIIWDGSAYPSSQTFGAVYKGGGATLSGGGVMRGMNSMNIGAAPAPGSATLSNVQATSARVQASGSASSASTSATMSVSDVAYTSASSGDEWESFGAERSGLVAKTTHNLGTGFGQKAEFKTQETSFTRGDMIALMVVYYDNKQGLQARGIDLGGRRKPTPQAFPAMVTGCRPPEGWEG